MESAGKRAGLAHLSAFDPLFGVSTGGWLWLDFLVVSGFLVVTALIAAKTYLRAIL